MGKTAMRELSDKTPLFYRQLRMSRHYLSQKCFFFFLTTRLIVYRLSNQN
jgi:hypothetical protein